MREHLILTFDAPLIAFGGEAIDGRGVVRDFPARSMLTGLLANALGWDRSESARLDGLQSRIDVAAIRLREGHRAREYQTAQLFERDAGWTTRGAPEGRAPSPSFTWDSGWEEARSARAKSLTHQRQRDHDADAIVLVALALALADGGEGEGPSLEQVARALERPERPLFIGRKPFVPSGPICGRDRVSAPSPVHALFYHLADAGWTGAAPAQWDPEEGDDVGDERSLGEARIAPDDSGADAAPLSGRLASARRERVADERRHRTGVHGGNREVARGTLRIETAPHAPHAPGAGAA